MSVPAESMNLCRDRASTEDIARHLRACDETFLARLEARSGIDSYARKLCDHAARSEIWSDKRLLALLAVYANRVETGTAFITNVSVVDDYSGKGLGSIVLKDALARVRSLGFVQVDLEVARTNEAAIGFYSRHEFVACYDVGDAVVMRRLLKEADLAAAADPANLGGGRLSRKLLKGCERL